MRRKLPEPLTDEWRRRMIARMRTVAHLLRTTSNYAVVLKGDVIDLAAYAQMLSEAYEEDDLDKATKALAAVL